MPCVGQETGSPQHPLTGNALPSLTNILGCVGGAKGPSAQQGAEGLDGMLEVIETTKTQTATADSLAAPLPVCHDAMPPAYNADFSLTATGTSTCWEYRPDIKERESGEC